MRRKGIWIGLALLAFMLYNWEELHSQPNREKLFTSPLDISLILSGNFGEIRGNHFHSGLDFKTNGRSGYPVYAAADGYVARIKVESGGYGKALYLIHPSGHMTVYGHLSNFSKDISQYVKSQQYKQERFGVNLYPNEKLFKVKQGEQIAISGNTGSSQAPHLHFEIRDIHSQNPINPLMEYFQVDDHKPPELYALYLYPLADRKRHKEAYKIRLSGANGDYFAANTVYPMDAIGGVGVETNDFLDGANNRCGIFELVILLDGDTIFHAKLDEFSFNESRYINSLVDYPKYQSDRKQIIKGFIEPNNRLSIYQFVQNQGKIKLSDNQIHTLNVQAIDVAGNESQCQIKVQLNPSAYPEDHSEESYYSAYFSYSEENQFNDTGIRLKIPKNALYDDLYFQYGSESKKANTFSSIHRLHASSTPLHRSIEIGIRPDSLPPHLKTKAILARVNKNGYFSSIGGKWQGEYLSSSTRSFGDYTIVVDTIPPVVQAVNLKTEGIATVGRTITFKLSDDLTGIYSYRGMLDGEWILFEYDGKTRRLFHTTDPYLFPPGVVKELVVRVADGVGNLTEFKQKVTR